MEFARDNQGRYLMSSPMTADQVLAVAETIVSERFYRQTTCSDPQVTAEFIRSRIGLREHEVFVALFLDQRHRVIAFRELFHGTIASCSVYPREVARQALETNAAALIVAHNHPSGSSEPSSADIELTAALKSALALLDIRLLDHIIVGAGPATSMANRGLV